MKLKELLAQATAQPWWIPAGTIREHTSILAGDENDPEIIADCDPDDPMAVEDDKAVLANAELIVRSRNSIGQMYDALEAIRADLGTMEWSTPEHAQFLLEQLIQRHYEPAKQALAAADRQD